VNPAVPELPVAIAGSFVSGRGGGELPVCAFETIVRPGAGPRAVADPDGLSADADPDTLPADKDGLQPPLIRQAVR
jgi:hypothetical protein